MTDTEALHSFVLLPLCAALLFACGSDPSPNHSPDEKMVCGYDYLGILSKDWPCDESIARLDGCEEIQIGYLANTFGNNRQCLDRFLADNRLTALRLHASNGPCVSNQRCASNEPLYGLDWNDADEIQRRTKEAMRREIAQIRVGNEMLYLSPILEHRLSIDGFEPIGRAAQEICPRCIIVDNPVIARQSRFLPEFHAPQVALQTPYGYSIDGYIGMSDEFLEQNNIAAYALDWDVSFNGLCLTEPWVFPLERRCW